MSSIFDIQQEITSIFEELEENGGELTEELYEKLNISREEFKSKVEAYINVIKSAKNDIELCKQENKRLKDRQKVKENLIDRLSKIIISAVEQFGDTSKTGVKFLDYGTGRISVKETQSVELNPLNTQICNQFFSNLNAKINYKMIEGATEVDCKEIIEEIKQEANTDITDFHYPIEELSVDDICALTAEVKFKVNIGNLLQGNGLQFLRNFVTYINEFKVDDGTSKTQLKDEFGSSIDELHIAKINNNKSIVIK